MLTRVVKILDWPTCFFSGALIMFGLLMVASASLNIAGQHFHEPWHFFLHHLCFLSVGLLLAMLTCFFPIAFWRQSAMFFFLLSLGLLVLVLLPGLGRTVNGSVRWLNLGPLGFQVSELVKLLFIMYIGDFLIRWQPSLASEFKGFIRLGIIFCVLGGLLLAEPDFGSLVVILGSAGSMLFLSGCRLRYLAGAGGGALIVLVGLIYAEPYRMKRLVAFLHPWDNQYSSGYQLTQSLIAFGRGGVWGRGLGHSVQKLFYLPEAHTDFLFAVLAEELGLVGSVSVVVLFVGLIVRMFMIARMAMSKKAHYHGLVVYGIAVWFALQAMINIGVNTGVLPTKGLTLPLMSYGGSSIVVSCIALAIVLRINYEIQNYSSVDLKSFSVQSRRFRW